MNDKKDTLTIEIKPSFLIILAVTLLLLVGLVVGLFIVMNRDGDSHLGHGGVGAPPGGGKTQTTTAASSEDIPVINDSTPFSPTLETRSSYKPVASASVVNISDAINANNAILVKVTKDSLVSTHEKAADTRIYPASITKVMTLIVACERVTKTDIDGEVKLEVTQEIAQYAAENDGSGAGLKVGDKYTVEDLLYLIAYKSDTIASMLIAEHIAGSHEAFVALMNEKAAELGMSGTHFENCTGLYHSNHYSTCRDIAAMMAYALDNELAYSCLTSYQGRAMTVGGVDCKFYAGWYSGRPGQNNLGFQDNPSLSTVKVLGGKTGYTDESGFTFVTVAQDKDDPTVRYINVMIGKPKGQGYTATKFMEDYKNIYNTYAK